MKILAIDTSSSVSAVAVADGERVLAEDDSASDERHGSVLLPRITAQLVAAGVEPAALELIAVGLGPGSFTGLRVGVATAKGLALALRIPIRGVSSLEAIACGALLHTKLAAVLLDGGRGDLYVAAYRGGGLGRTTVALAPVRAAASEALSRVAELARAQGPLALCGSGARLHATALASELPPGSVLLDAACDLPQARNVALAGLARFASEGPSDLASLEPAYLRDSDAKLPDEPLAL
jgi:tRNA threonylcarbamoyladenosine biosynthesis protein TsaB